MNIRFASYVTTAVITTGLTSGACLEKMKKKHRDEELVKVAAETFTSFQKAEKTYEEAKERKDIAFESYINSCNTYPPRWGFVSRIGKKYQEEAYTLYEDAKKLEKDSSLPLIRATELFRKTVLTPPERFLETLEALNGLKGSKDLPVAVILRAKADHNGGCSRVHTFAGILTIAQTHRVAMETIGSRSQIREALQKTKDRMGKPVDLLVVMAHGCEHAMEFGEEGCDAVYHTTDVNKEDFSAMNPCGTVILDSCNVGKALAPEIAAVTGLTVIAPIAPIEKDVNRFRRSEKYGIVASCRQHARDYVKREEIFRVFRPGEPPTTPC